jgi:hypothetical protein
MLREIPFEAVSSHRPVIRVNRHGLHALCGLPVQQLFPAGPSRLRLSSRLTLRNPSVRTCKSLALTQQSACPVSTGHCGAEAAPGRACDLTTVASRRWQACGLARRRPGLHQRCRLGQRYTQSIVSHHPHCTKDVNKLCVCGAMYRLLPGSAVKPVAHQLC